MVRCSECDVTRNVDRVKRKGFTLIGLLVVIAIIAILAAILFPVFARARENARRASCQSNLKQIALGMMMYTQDFDERLPSTWLAGTSTGGPQSPTNPAGWADAIQPYIKNLQVYRCPSVGRTFQGVRASGPTTNPSGSGYTSYWMNVFASNKKIAQFQFPTTTVLFGDGGGGNSKATYASNGCTENNYGGYCSKYIVGGKDPSIDPPGAFATIPFGGGTAHLGGGNYAFADGHVKWLKGVEGKWTTTSTNSGDGTLCTGIKNGMTTHAVAGKYATFLLD